MLKIGFLINPIAGMGGRVGLKGTDGMYLEAVKRGAKPVAPSRAREFLLALKEKAGVDFELLTVSGPMGEVVVKELGIPYRVISSVRTDTTREDTIESCEKFIENGVSLIVFVGGDGTARDVARAVQLRVPAIGVPAGVKMYSSVFCLTPSRCGSLVAAFLNGQTRLRDGEVLDIDEDAYRRNELKIRLYGVLRIPYLENLVQSSKSEYGHSDEEEKEAIAEFFAENAERDVLYLLGAGTTTAKIAEKLGVECTLLGVDAVYNGKTVAFDLTEDDILSLLDRYKTAKIVVSPIGSQGFIFGRGNQQFSDRVIYRVGKENIMVVATPTKLRDIKTLKVDIENPALLRGYIKVLIGYGKYRMMKIE